MANSRTPSRRSGIATREDREMPLTRLTAMIIFCAATVGVGAGIAGDRWSEAVLPAVVAAATVAYTGFTWLLVQTSEKDRKHERDKVLAGLMVELQQNRRRKGQTNVWLTDVRFSNLALTASSWVRLGLAEVVQTQLHEVESRIARYNTLVEFEERNPTGGSQRQQVDRLARDVYDSLDVAITSVGPLCGDRTDAV